MKTRRFCPQCGAHLKKATIKDYVFQCLHCGEDFYRIEVLSKKNLPKVKALRRERHIRETINPDKWWGGTDFDLMERLSGYRQADFNPEDGYQEFVDACDKWWKSLPKRDKYELCLEHVVENNDLYAPFNYIDCLYIPMKIANMGCHTGQCDEDISRIRELPEIKRQLDRLDKEKLREELREYGAWSEEELLNHDDNLTRILWIACGDIIENSETETV